MSWNLVHTSTVMVHFEVFNKVITYDELVKGLFKLTSNMWISTDVMTEVIQRTMFSRS
jgi:hypothetical protein